MAQRDNFARPLRCHDGSQLSHRQDVSFFQIVLSDQFGNLAAHSNDSTRTRRSLRGSFLPDVDHSCLSCHIYMREILCAIGPCEEALRLNPANELEKLITHAFHLPYFSTCNVYECKYYSYIYFTYMKQNFRRLLWYRHLIVFMFLKGKENLNDSCHCTYTFKFESSANQNHRTIFHLRQIKHT